MAKTIFERLYEFQDLEKERHVLYSCINHKDAILKIFDILELDDFYSKKAHRYIYEAIMSCMAKNIPIDIVSVNEELRTLGYTKKQVPQTYLMEVSEAFPSSASVKQSAERLRRLTKARKYIKSLYKNFTPHDDIMQIILDHQKELLEITFEQKANIIDLMEEVDEVKASIERRLEGKELIGHPWSSKRLTFLTGGIEPNYIYVYGAREKSGKSKFILDNIVNLASYKVNQLFLSLEMIRTQVARWTWSRVAEVDSKKLKNPKLLNEEEKYRLKLGYERLQDELSEYIHVDDQPGLRMIDFKAKVINWLNHVGSGVVWLDFLQRCNLEQVRGETKAEAIERTTRLWADIVKELPISLVYMSQLKKRSQGERNDFNDLLGSGGIAQNANCIILANNFDRIYMSKNKEVNKGVTELNVMQRDGENGSVRVKHLLDIGVYHDEGDTFVSRYERQEPF